MWGVLGSFTFDELLGKLQNFGEKLKQGRTPFKFLEELLLQEKGYIHYFFLILSYYFLTSALAIMASICLICSVERASGRYSLKISFTFSLTLCPIVFSPACLHLS